MSLKKVFLLKQLNQCQLLGQGITEVSHALCGPEENFARLGWPRRTASSQEKDENSCSV